MTAIALLHRDTIIERLQHGERVSSIAASLGVTGPAITQQLSNDPDYKAAREAGMELMLDQAEEAIDSANDQLSLARARDSWRAKSWRASVEHAHRWGQVRPQAAPVAVQVNIGTIERRIVRADQIDRPQPPHLENGVEDAE